MFDEVQTETLERWQRLHLPAEVLAEIDQEINARKD